MHGVTVKKNSENSKMSICGHSKIDYEGDVFLLNVGNSLLVLDDSSVCYICITNFSEGHRILQPSHSSRYDSASFVISFHSFSSLSYDRSKASSKVSSPHSAI